MQEQPLLQLYSTVLRVRKLETSVEWYERVLNFREAYRDLHYRLRLLQDDQGRQLALWEVDHTGDPVPAQRDGSYLAFVTPNAEAARAELLRRGGAPEPVATYPGLRMFWLPDPDGHQHAVMQFLLD